MQTELFAISVYTCPAKQRYHKNIHLVIVYLGRRKQKKYLLYLKKTRTNLASQ